MGRFWGEILGEVLEGIFGEDFRRILEPFCGDTGRFWAGCPSWWQG